MLDPFQNSRGISQFASRPGLKKCIKGYITARSDAKDAYFYQKAGSKKSTKRNIKYIHPRAGLALQLGTQTKTNGLESISTTDITLDNNAEHTECAAVMDKEPISQTDEQPILDTPHREITLVLTKELFPMDICTSVSNNCTGPQEQAL